MPYYVSEHNSELNLMNLQYSTEPSIDVNQHCLHIVNYSMKYIYLVLVSESNLYVFKEKPAYFGGTLIFVYTSLSKPQGVHSAEHNPKG